MEDRSRLIFNLILWLFMLSIAEGAELPKEVSANDILNKIEAGQPVQYDNVIIIGNLDLSKCHLPSEKIDLFYKEPHKNYTAEKKLVISSINITNSIINEAVDFNNTLFQKPVFFNQTRFVGHAGFRGANFESFSNLSLTQFKKYADFLGSVFLEKAIFENTQFCDYADFEGSYLNNSAHFFNSSFNSSADFKYSTFNGTANFQGLTFKGHADFMNSTFNDIANFWKSAFKGDADFMNSTFNSYADFWKSAFKGDADFRDSAFKGDAGFRDSAFNGIADFRDSAFKGDVSFMNSAFNDIADFEGSAFNGTANFGNWLSNIGVTFNGTANFGGSVFNGIANFHNSAFNRIAYFMGSDFNGTANFQGSVFNGTANFQGSVFNGTANFGGSDFKGIANFEYSKLNITDFSTTQFNKEAQFNDAQFAGTAYFDNSRFAGDALFENTDFQSKLSLTRARYDKLFIRWNNITGGLVYDDAAYMSLMKNFKNLGYFEDYDSCYFQYRKEHRYQTWSIPGETFLKFIDFLSEWSYGYGVRPMNPLLSSIVLIISFGLFWRSKGIGRTEQCNDKCNSADDSPPNQGQTALKWFEPQTILDVLSPFTFSFILFVSAGRFLIDPPELPESMKKPNSWTKRMFDLEKFLGGIFLALFFIALSSTMIRAL